MTQPAFDWTAVEVAPAEVRLEPAAVASRRSGRRRAQAAITASMARYRDALLAYGPCTDQDLADRSGLPLSSICARRNDWAALRPGAVEATGRVPQAWARGKATTRTVWRFVP